MNRFIPQQDGFTLVELLVTLAIVTIVAVVGIPSYRSTIANQTSVTSINELVTSMNLARSSALKTGKHVTICRSANGSTCTTTTGDWSDGWIVFSNNSFAGASIRSADEELLRSFQALAGRVTLTGSGGLGNYVSFRPTGDTDITGDWTLCDERGVDFAKAIVLFRSGRAQISKTQADGSQLSCNAGGGV